MNCVVVCHPRCGCCCHPPLLLLSLSSSFLIFFSGPVCDWVLHQNCVHRHTLAAAANDDRLCSCSSISRFSHWKLIIGVRRVRARREIQNHRWMKWVWIKKKTAWKMNMGRKRFPKFHFSFRASSILNEMRMPVIFQANREHFVSYVREKSLELSNRLWR